MDKSNKARSLRENTPDKDWDFLFLSSGRVQGLSQRKPFLGKKSGLCETQKNTKDAPSAKI
jgi:hypothetical protein